MTGLSQPSLAAAVQIHAHAASGGATGGRVELIRSAVPPKMAEAVEQARALMEAALNLGRARLGFQREPARYLDAALAETRGGRHRQGYELSAGPYSGTIGRELNAIGKTSGNSGEE